MSTMWEIKENFKTLQLLAEDPECDPQVIQDTMEAIDGEFEDKADGYARVMAELKVTAKTLEARAKAIQEEADRVMGMAKSVYNNIDCMKVTLQKAMKETGKEKFATEYFKFGIVKNPPKLVIDSQKDIPFNFLIPQDPKVDSTALKNYLKTNKTDWAHLEQTERLDIK